MKKCYLLVVVLLVFVPLALYGYDNHMQKKLAESIRKDDAEGVKKLVSENPKLVRRVFAYNTTALNLAIQAGKTKVVQVLVDAGSDLYNDAELWGLPLQHAATVPNMEIINILLDAGVDINHQPGAGTVSHSNGTALHHAARMGHVDIVTLLLEKGADANAPCLKKKGNQTPLYEAVWKGRTEEDRLKICSELLKHGANVNARTIEGDTPLDRAIALHETHKPNGHVIELLKKNGAKRGEELEKA